MKIDDYGRVMNEFYWNIPPEYNLGLALIKGAQQAKGKSALAMVDAKGSVRHYSFQDLDRQSNRLANRLVSLGAKIGDCVAVMLPPSAEAAICHLAILKAGMISLPLIEEHNSAQTDRLMAAGAQIICTSKELAEIQGDAWRANSRIRHLLPVAEKIASNAGDLLEQLLAGCSDQFTAARTRPEDPAILSFTSGSEGLPKGVLHAHSVVLGTLPALIFAKTPVCGDIVWSHFEWGSLGGLLIAFCAWHSGATVLVEQNPSLAPGRIINLWSEFAVTRVSIAPTVLKMLRSGSRNQAFPRLSSITSGGEKLDSEMRHWVHDRFGTELGEIYGLTECSGVMGSGHAVETIDGAIGKPAPGQIVEILGPDGHKMPAGEQGTIAVKGPHPAMFKGYWQNETATRAKFHGDYLLTGDIGYQDDRGYFYYVSRGDDIISSGGRRIGPGEIEAMFERLPAVKLCAAIGMPNALIGQEIVVWLTLNPEYHASIATENEIMAEVRKALPARLLPRRLRIVEEMPLTATGKVHRSRVREIEHEKLAAKASAS